MRTPGHQQLMRDGFRRLSPDAKLSSPHGGEEFGNLGLEPPAIAQKPCDEERRVGIVKFRWTGCRGMSVRERFRGLFKKYLIALFMAVAIPLVINGAY